MSKESTATAFPAADFISENAARGVFGRRWPGDHPYAAGQSPS